MYAYFDYLNKQNVKATYSDYIVKPENESEKLCIENGTFELGYGTSSDKYNGEEIKYKSFVAKESG